MKTHKVRPVLIEIYFNLIEEMQGDIILRDNKLYTCKQLNTLQLHKKESNDKVFELILISLEDEKIEVGDAYYSKTFEDIYKTTCLSLAIKDAKKVIARQYQIPPEYISKFIEQYNNGCVEDLEIVMENRVIKHIPWSKELESKYDYEKGYPVTGYVPKLTNGFVIIVEKEPINYTEGEVLNLLHKLELDKNINLAAWFEQNKKK